MARYTKPLTVNEIKNAQPKEKDYKLFDGEGLFLLIKKNGVKTWKLKYTFEGKEKLLVIGNFTDIPLAKARELKSKYRQQIAEGINPSEQRQNKKKAIKEKHIAEEENTRFTFKNLAEQLLLERLTNNDISDVHYKRMLNAFKNDAYPFIENKPIKNVTTNDIKTIITKVAERGANESARKLYYALSKTFKTLITRDNPQNPDYNYQITNPPAPLDLESLVGKRTKQNYPTFIKDNDIKALLLNIDEYTGDYTTKQALRMLPYVFVRPYNIRYAEWNEIDLKNKQWTIPGTKMKTKHELIVPLTNSVIKILEEMKPFSGDGQYIFPSLKNKNAPMSDNTLLGAIRRLGYSKDEFVPHGFRAMFSTIAHEKSPFLHDVIETQLAHSVGNSVSKAYNRAKYLEERVKLMQWWSDYLDALKAKK
ncbi:tyrosine-type recombinase/integrase [Sulfurimonas microaerophilic]|uniref:tyrosine-type recombinase/integrase n=1 Tax=Sulfurimonas microaerophilic TaxID=3058392 RepID=UPI0027144E6E|nr:integrase arm-type DNA-binding domain-containing protein [Sulfurimonas sp. hsl 1-7]